MSDEKAKGAPSMMADELGDQAWRSDKPDAHFFEPTYSGALSFLRRPYSHNFAAADVAVTGIPYDGAVTYRPGSRLGPRAIRAASVQLAELDAFPFGFSMPDYLSVIDAGDVVLNPHDPSTIFDAIYHHAKAIIDTDTKLLSFGGDHFVAYPLIKAHVEKYGPIALLQFDAHSDTWDSFGPLDHGTMFYEAVKEGLIDVAHSAQVGLRTHNERDVGMKVLTAPQVHKRGVDDILAEVIAHIGDRACYVSFDIDVLDPAFAPGTGTPVSGGLATWQALELVRGLAPLNLIGMDLVEVSPPFDHAEITALAAATIAHDWLGVLAQQKKAKS